MTKTVYVGMSGGVDSSVAAALLKQAGYQVVGVYMKNWTQDLPGMECPWQQDYRDALKVAVKLGIELKVYDFETEYRARVVDYMLKAYQAGQTPNPDIRCNQDIKFKLFYDTAKADGADLIATGHYAKAKQGKLMMAADRLKDQTYFLYRIDRSVLKDVLFPLGDLKKAEVRGLAKKLGLATADKPDSQGICFVGQVGIKDFIVSQLGPQTEGPIVDETGQQVGRHDGAIYFTIGQRRGINVGGGLPYYVSAKDMNTNTVYVTRDLSSPGLWRGDVKLLDLHWLVNEPSGHKTYRARLRHRGELVEAKLSQGTIKLVDEQRGVAPGQSAVLYEDELVVGGGVIA